MTTTRLLAVLGFSLIVSRAFAGDLAPATQDEPAAIVPRSAISFGVGGNLNYSVYGKQYVYALGTGSYLDERGATLASGFAQGPLTVGMGSQVRVAPSAQLKYFRYLDETNWLVGANFSYSYLDSSVTTHHGFIPQWGQSFLNNGNILPAAGNAYMHTYQARLNHQMQWTPFVGYGFSKGFVYVGAGPSFSQVQTKIYNLIGYAQVGGEPTNQSGAPQNFSGSNWVFGGAITAGGTYFLSRNWYLDFNYTYSQPRTPTNFYFSLFKNPTNERIYLAGTLQGNSAGTQTSHSFVATLNWAYDFSK